MWEIESNCIGHIGDMCVAGHKVRRAGNELGTGSYLRWRRLSTILSGLLLENGTPADIISVKLPLGELKEVDAL